MKHTFTLDAWFAHIRKQLRTTPTPTPAEIKQPLRFDWRFMAEFFKPNT